jgi:hypothetical protein
MRREGWVSKPGKFVTVFSELLVLDVAVGD